MKKQWMSSVNSVTLRKPVKLAVLLSLAVCCVLCIVYKKNEEPEEIYRGLLPDYNLENTRPCFKIELEELLERYGRTMPNAVAVPSVYEGTGLVEPIEKPFFHNIKYANGKMYICVCYGYDEKYKIRPGMLRGPDLKLVKRWFEVNFEDNKIGRMVKDPSIIESSSGFTAERYRFFSENDVLMREDRITGEKRRLYNFEKEDEHLMQRPEAVSEEYVVFRSYTERSKLRLLKHYYVFDSDSGELVRSFENSTCDIVVHAYGDSIWLKGKNVPFGDICKMSVSTGNMSESIDVREGSGNFGRYVVRSNGPKRVFLADLKDESYKEINVKGNAAHCYVYDGRGYFTCCADYDNGTTLYEYDFSSGVLREVFRIEKGCVYSAAYAANLYCISISDTVYCGLLREA